MGAYIVGLNKPENEKDCNFYEEVFMRPFPYCHLIHKSCAGLEHCPIIEIREPHGRLIDVDYADDYAYDELELANSYLTGWEAARAMQKIYQNAPTVIPASKEGEG